ncbi:PQQ-binding-like beta-propeller repeat protein [Streptomyces sp. NPDC020681]|uniref:outer membrane protein assembly factor BamB family protein n=1 Tax=Streptomyces sp. NPDC020681 TaxID=3365083 RepID=UPI003796B3C3
MEPLQQDDPRRIGPYGALARLGESASSVRYLALDADGSLTAVSRARPELAAVPAFRRRYQSEARTAERLAGGWVPEPLGSRTDGDELWTASAYVPALTLREAVALAGPLPERTVRILGAALAETLSRVHATGAVLHGLAPDTVLLAADGPRLTAFGALGAAAGAVAGPGGLSVQLGYLTPEQATGADPGPASDIFVLGLLLSYASTGTTPLPDADRIAHGEPELAGVPDELRPLIASCLSKPPESRPPAGTVAADLALEGASALARDGWLPGVLTEAIEGQAGAAETLRTAGAWTPAAPVAAPAPSGYAAAPPAPHGPTGAIVPQQAGSGRGSVAAGHAGGGSAAAVAPAFGGGQGHGPAGPFAPAAAAPQTAGHGGGWQGDRPTAALGVRQVPASADGTSRRAVLVGVVAGAAGVVLGGGGVYALGGEEDAPKAKPTTPVRRARVAGMAPEPVWRYEHAGAAPNATVCGGGSVLVLTAPEHTTGVDLRTGRQLWQLKDAASVTRAVPVDNELCLVDSTAELVWISARDGKIRHRVAKTALAGPGETLTLGGLSGSDSSTLWMTGHIRKGKALTAHFFAYDLAARSWLWRTPVPGGLAPRIPRYDLIAVRPGDIVVRQDAASLTAAQRKTAKGASTLLVFDRKTGRRRQAFALPGVLPAAAIAGDATDKVFAAVAGELQAFSSRTGVRQWRMAGARPAAGETGVFPFGKGVLRGPMLYVANRHQEVCAVDTATGRSLWRRSTEAPVWNAVPGTALSASGQTVLAGDGAQLTAFAARDGKRLWKFQEAGAKDVPGGARYVPLPGGSGKSLVVQREGTFYALDVE